MYTSTIGTNRSQRRIRMGGLNFMRLFLGRLSGKHIGVLQSPSRAIRTSSTRPCKKTKGWAGGDPGVAIEFLHYEHREKPTSVTGGKTA